MNPFKKIALTLAAALALFAGDAMAQTCGGKTVNIQLPGGWSTTQIYMMWEGNLRNPAITASLVDGWVRFTMPTGMANDGANQYFYFSKASTNIDNGDNKWITKSSFDFIGARPETGRFTCSDFGSSNTLYIYENRGSTVIKTNAPYTFFFLPPDNVDWITSTPYLIWAAGNGLQGQAMEIEPAMCGWFKMTYFDGDPPDAQSLVWPSSLESTPRGTGCGGYTPIDQVGLKGMDEEIEDWANNEIPGCAGFFSLKERFTTLDARTIYFAPDNGTAGWTKTDPGINQRKRCTYNFAAIIYDTDASANSSFFDYGACTFPNGCLYDGKPTTNPFGSPVDGAGISKNIPKNELVLDAATGRMKMEFNQAKDGWTADNFRDAFKPTPGKNVVRCYDMPFERNRAGLWEFNSNKLCSDGSMDLEGNCQATSGRYLGGFFPPELQTRGTADYSECPNCEYKRAAQGWVDYYTSRPVGNDNTSIVSKFCYDRGRRGTATGPDISGCGDPFGEGHFANGDNTPTNFWVWSNDRDCRLGPCNNDGPTAGNPIGAAGTITIAGDGWSNKTMFKNELFCFESAPTEFTYEPGQEFFFSGDDDIWVFINNKLVIDLGGTHLAAPGYVNLDNLNLTKGEKYPINIFFCDRRTTMSNVRISTGMYFSQKTGLEVNAREDGKTFDVCLNSEGGGSCADVFSDGGGSSLKCGGDVAPMLDFYLQRRNGQKCSLIDRAADAKPYYNDFDCSCTRAGNMLTCNGGIKVDLDAGAVQINRDAIFGLAGQYYVYTKIKDGTPNVPPELEPARVTSFTVNTNIAAVWNKIYRDDGTFILDLGAQNKSTVAGKAVPVGFASGVWKSGTPGDGDFEVLMEASPGMAVTLEQAGLETDVRRGGLKVFRDEAMTQEVASNTSFTIPETGLLVLWVTGDYETEGDVDYSVNARNPSGPALGVKVYVPRLAFIDPATAGAANPTRLEYTYGSDYSKINTRNPREMEELIGTALERAVAAYDVSGSNGNFQQGVLCTSCNFPLTAHAWAKNIRTGASAENLGEDDNLMTIIGGVVENGIATFDIVGRQAIPLLSSTDPDTMGFFSVRGPSRWDAPNLIAQWDSLLFYKPDVPIPYGVEIFDENGDGIGDKLRITYNRKFNMDSLPNFLEVFWDKDEADVVNFGLGTKNARGEYSNAGISPQTNREYWTKDGRSIEADSIIVITGINFSNDIKTYAAGEEKVRSWSTFIHPKTHIETHTGFEWGISDKIPAIVISARYEGEGGGCGTAFNAVCDDRLTVKLSEPVVGIEDVPDRGNAEGGMRERPFTYKLLSFNKDSYALYSDGKDLPLGAGGNERRNMCWGNNCGAATRSTQPVSAGDSIVYMRYQRYKSTPEGSGDSAYTPMAGDSLKFASGGFAALMDKKGNLPNPNEKGRRIEGVKPFDIDIVRIADQDPDAKILEDAIGRLIDEKGFDNSLRDKFDFNGGSNAIELLPGGGDWVTDSVKVFYPGSVGQLFKPDVSNKVGNLEDSLGIVIPSESITFHVNAFYHTNLGNFVVKSELPPVKCDDDIFKVNGVGDCKSFGTTNDNASVYLAWNLKDGKKRWVGTGAYVQLYDFYWKIDYDRDGVKIHESYDKQKGVTEMLGVRRVKTKQ